MPAVSPNVDVDLNMVQSIIKLDLLQAQALADKNESTSHTYVVSLIIVVTYTYIIGSQSTFILGKLYVHLNLCISPC